MSIHKNFNKMLPSKDCQKKKLRTRKIVHKLKDQRLRKIRYELRTLLNLEYHKRIDGFFKQLDELSELLSSNLLSYEETSARKMKIRRRIERLRLQHSQCSIGCGWCGDRMEDLVFNPKRQCWFCTTCYEDAHKQYPEEYP